MKNKSRKKNMKSKALIFMIAIIFSICAFAGCEKNKTKLVEVTQWDNFYDGNNIHFYYEDENNASIKQLKDKYKLDDVVKDSKDEMDKALKLVFWMKNKIKFQKTSISTKEDSISILEQIKNEGILSDKEHAIIFSQAASSVGLYARRGELKIKDSAFAKTKEEYYYYLCEIWNDKLGKWVMIDPGTGAYMESQGTPLSVVEIIEKGIDNVKVKNVKDEAKYIKDMKKYFYCYTINIDNNIYQSKKSNSGITYIRPGERPEIKTVDKYIAPTIFVNKTDLFKKSPKIKYENDKSDKKATLIFSKDKFENDKNSKIAFIGAAFRNSSMIKDYYISINNAPWFKVGSSFQLELMPGENSIKLSLDGKTEERVVKIVNNNEKK